MRVSSFRIVVEQEPKELTCRATILSDSGHELFRIQDATIDVASMTGKDITGDGHPDAVLESFSGGAHCCWTYSVVSLAENGGLIRQFENRAPASFKDLSQDGSVELLTADGVFDEFDGLPHPFSPFPTLILRLKHDKFVDVGREFWPVYQEKINQIRRDIKPQVLQEFIQSKPAEVHDDLNYLQTERRVLTIALEYLYGGRPQQGWRTLEQMWPPNDRHRIKDAIMAKYCAGLRADLGLPSAPSCHSQNSGQQIP